MTDIEIAKERQEIEIEKDRKRKIDRERETGRERKNITKTNIVRKKYFIKCALDVKSN